MALWGGAALLLTGCTPNGWYSTPPTITPFNITALPTNQIVPPGATATFSVTVTSTEQLSYQWSENGVDIPGAIGASYTTPPVVLGPNGSTTVGTFQVLISDSAMSDRTQPVTLAIGPRVPKPGDLRYLLFQQVPSSDLGPYSPASGVNTWADNALGTPLSMGYGGWSSEAQFLNTPSCYDIHYQSDSYSYLASDMQTISTSSVVVTSLGFELGSPMGNGMYAMSWEQNTQAGGFDYRFDPIIPSGTGQPSQIQAQAALDGTQSRIITAAFFDPSGSANLVSYGWQGDTTTVYEAQTTLVPPGSNVTAAVATAATTLANEGYFISAFGGDDTNGYVLVGMRVQGDTYPRPIEMQTFTLGTSGTTPATNPTWANFTVVAWLQETGNDVIVLEQ